MAINESFNVKVRDVVDPDDEGPGTAMDFLNASKQNPPGDRVKDMRGSFGGGIIAVLEALGLSWEKN